MSLPNPGMSFDPFDTLPASAMNDIVENIEALADGSGLNDDAIEFSKLLATIFSDTLQTVANSGTAGGTWSYINLGGIKLAWCIGSSSAGTSAFTRTWIPPTSFFTTITNVQATINSVATLSEQYVFVTGVSTSSITTGAVSPGGAASNTIALLIIGT